MKNIIHLIRFIFNFIGQVKKLKNFVIFFYKLLLILHKKFNNNVYYMFFFNKVYNFFLKKNIFYKIEVLINEYKMVRVYIMLLVVSVIKEYQIVCVIFKIILYIYEMYDNIYRYYICSTYITRVKYLYSGIDISVLVEACVGVIGVSFCIYFGYTYNFPELTFSIISKIFWKLGYHTVTVAFYEKIVDDMVKTRIRNYRRKDPYWSHEDYSEILQLFLDYHDYYTYMVREYLIDIGSYTPKRIGNPKDYRYPYFEDLFDCIKKFAQGEINYQNCEEYKMHYVDFMSNMYNVFKGLKKRGELPPKDQINWKPTTKMKVEDIDVIAIYLKKCNTPEARKAAELFKKKIYQRFDRHKSFLIEKDPMGYKNIFTERMIDDILEERNRKKVFEELTKWWF